MSYSLLFMKLLTIAPRILHAIRESLITSPDPGARRDPHEKEYLVYGNTSGEFFHQRNSLLRGSPGAWCPDQPGYGDGEVLASIKRFLAACCGVVHPESGINIDKTMEARLISCRLAKDGSPDMSTIIVACHTLTDELNLAIRSTGVSYPVVWIDSKLHIKPEKLKEEVQATLLRISNVSTILLVFGYCGNGLAGIRSETARLILPRVEDCISILLGSQERRTELSRTSASYYLTKGWIESESNITDEWNYSVRRFGEERGARIMRAMLKNYRHLTLIDTGAYDIMPYEAKTEDLAKKLGLTHQVVKGSQRLFQKLLVGPWDGEFVITEPGEAVPSNALFGLNLQA
jgi:hypothetical protein